MPETDKKETHVYIGRAKCGCCRAFRCDDGDKATGEFVAEMIESGLTIERITGEVARTMTMAHVCGKRDGKAVTP